MQYDFRIGGWSDNLFVMLQDDDDLDHFKDLKLSTLHDEDDKIIYLFFNKDTRAHKASARQIGQHSIRNYGGGNTNGSGYSVPIQLFPTIPKFAIHDIGVHLIDDGTMAWHLPPLYKLPWCNRYTNFEAFSDFNIRLKSAERNGLSLVDFLKTVPDEIRATLSAEQWMACVTGTSLC